uniref:Fibronectin type-III domain-containing protein n=1 Tax=Setaria digitata TaxID=48799 RepID=A0A915PYM8_9BILA
MHCQASATRFPPTIYLKVKKPVITLCVLEVGSHYVTLVWNASLSVRAKDRVRFFVVVRDEHGVTRRTIQLAVYNPWHTYNIMRLNAAEVHATAFFIFIIAKFSFAKLRGVWQLF